jgi:hypothetical protein
VTASRAAAGKNSLVVNATMAIPSSANNGPTWG